MFNKEEGITLLTLFNGIGCGNKALEEAGIKVKTTYASEIDKYAINVAQKNYPNTIQLGDVTKWREWDIDWSKVDVLFAGFCCQSWSMAGKQQGDKDPRGQLMWDMLDIREHLLKHNPNAKYLFENVKMKKEFQEYVNKAIGVEPILLDSALLGAQSRKRLFWTNIEGIRQPEEQNIFVEDILQPEHEVEEKYYINNINEINWVLNPMRLKKRYTSVSDEKALPMMARQYANWNGNYYMEPVRLINIGNGGQGERVYYVNAKSTTLSAMGGGRGAKTGLYLVEVDMETTDTFIVAQRGRHIVDGKRVDYFGAPTIQRLESRFDGKTNTISTVQKDNYVLVELDGKYFRIRKLTPIECERLMNLPDNYTAGISDSQRYKCLGNGWDVSIIKWILSFYKG